MAVVVVMVVMVVVVVVVAVVAVVVVVAVVGSVFSEATQTHTNFPIMVFIAIQNGFSKAMA